MYHQRVLFEGMQATRPGHHTTRRLLDIRARIEEVLVSGEIPQFALLGLTKIACPDNISFDALMCHFGNGEFP